MSKAGSSRSMEPIDLGVCEFALPDVIAMSVKAHTAAKMGLTIVNVLCGASENRIDGRIGVYRLAKPESNGVALLLLRRHGLAIGGQQKDFLALAIDHANQVVRGNSESREIFFGQW